MMKSKIASGLLILAILVAGYWLITGAHIWTKTEVPVQVEDELFGTTTTEWKREFHPGLEYVAPVVLLLLSGSGALIWRSRRSAKRSSREGKAPVSFPSSL